MEIDVSGIMKTYGASLDIDFEGEIAGMDDISGEYVLDGPVAFKGTATRAKGVVKLEGILSAEYAGICARCLEKIRIEVQLSIAEDYIREASDGENPVQGGSAGDKSESGIGYAGSVAATEETEDSEGRYFLYGNLLVLDKALKDNLILNLPLKLLCRDDCRGICPGCGTDLNKRVCSCNGNDRNSGIMMEKLRDLKL